MDCFFYLVIYTMSTEHPPLDPPPSTSKSNGHSNLLPRSPKPSLFSRWFRLLVPCVSPTAHPVEIESPSLLGFAEKSIVKNDDHPTTTVSTPPATPKEGSIPIPTPTPTLPPAIETVAVTPPLEISVDSPPAGQNDLLVPPTPPHILPLSETEGVTSGAVQPPGSTGDTTVHHEKSHTRDSIVIPSNGSGEGDESESTSFTEDEDIDGLDDLEDEEEKLIMDGGVGIPVGPVSSSLYPVMLWREHGKLLG